MPSRLLGLFPSLFSWTGVALVFLGNCVFGGLGINIGYHRLLRASGSFALSAHG